MTPVFFLVFVFSATANAQCNEATVCQNAVFCSGFDQTNPKSDWDDGDGNPDSQNQIVADAGICSSAANKVMRLIGDGSDMRKNLSSARFGGKAFSKLYMRWYQKFETGYEFRCASSGCHGPQLAAGLPPGSDGRSDWLWDEGMFKSGYRPPLVPGFDPREPGVYLQPMFKANFDLVPTPGQVRPSLYTYYHAMFMNGDGECNGLPCFNVTGPVGSYGSGGVFGDSFPCAGGFCEGRTEYGGPGAGVTAFATDRWYCFEIMLDGGTPTSTITGASGQVDYWIDGKQAGPYRGLWMRSSDAVKVRSIWFPNNYVGNTRIDNIVVSTQKVGCFGAAPPGPSPTLPPPGNLRLVN